MKPIGLTLKKDGELMIVHLCLNCGRLSPNRIAGDDNTRLLVELLSKNNYTRGKRFTLLNKKDENYVKDALFGSNEFAAQ